VDNGRNPGAVKNGAGATGSSDSVDVWTRGSDPEVPSGHAAQINRLIDDLLAGRPHETTLASTRPTMELVTALYASSIERDTIRRSDLTPDRGFYHRLDGGLPAEVVTARMRLG